MPLYRTAEPHRFGMTYELVKYAAALRDLTPDEVLAHTRSQSICQLRFAIIWALRQLNPKIYSYHQIKMALGYDDHTSIYNGYMRAVARRDTDHQFRYLTNRLLNFARSRSPYLATDRRLRSAA